MKKKKLKHSLTLLMIYMMLMIGCGSRTSSEEQVAAILGNPDSLPSWKGLEPGVSTEEDVLQLIDTFNEEEISNLRLPTTHSWFYRWHNNSISTSIEVWLEGGKVSHLEFAPRSKIPIAFFADVLGDPDSYSVMMFYGEQPFLAGVFVYEAEGILLDVFSVTRKIDSDSFQGCRYQLATAEIDGVIMKEPSRLYDNDSRVISQHLLEDLRPWTDSGFVEVSECENYED